MNADGCSGGSRGPPWSSDTRSFDHGSHGDSFCFFGDVFLAHVSLLPPDICNHVFLEWKLSISCLLATRAVNPFTIWFRLPHPSLLDLQTPRNWEIT